MNYLPPEARPQTDRYGRKVTPSSTAKSEELLARNEQERKRMDEENRKANRDWERERAKEEKDRAKRAEINRRGQDYEQASDPYGPTHRPHRDPDRI